MKSLKNYLFVILLSLSFLAQGQDYDKLSVEPYIGVTKIRDVTSVQDYNAGLSVRYMLNPLFGGRLSIGHTDLSTVEEFKWQSASLEGVVNVGRLLKFEDFLPWYTILGGIGGTYTYSDGYTNDQLLHRYSNFHLSATIDNEFRVAHNLAFKASLSVVTGVNDRPFVPTSTETTSLINFNIGFVASIGKYKQHADWAVEEPLVKIVDQTITLKPQVHNHTHLHITKKNCDCEGIEYVFFDHDSDVINRSGLNAINKIINRVKGDSKITIIGWASPTKGQEQYNINLSKRRALAVKNKMEMVGIQSHKIDFEVRGKDYEKSFLEVHDLGRRVTIILE